MFKRKKNVPEEKPKKKEKQKRKPLINFKFKLMKAGILVPASEIRPMIIKFSIILCLLTTFVLVYSFFTMGFYIEQLLMYVFIAWLIGITLLIIIQWLLFYFYLEIRIFRRSKEIEKVLPDFLQIASANIRSGMNIEKALWYAVRPNFGVLAKEIEMVAKEVMSGKDLIIALEEFSSRYQSVILTRAISLLIEGIKSGGEIGELLYKISNNIQETELMKKDMAANVATYSIFITFASIIAAPVLFALSGSLLTIVTSIFSKITVSSDMKSQFPISFEGAGITYQDYFIFAIVTLTLSSFFSAIIVATIKKGDAKYGVKYAPIFIAVSLILFIILSKLMGKLFAGMF
jgi:pilus assembly protein TadC